MKRVFIADLAGLSQQRVLLQGWVHRLRETKSTTFIILRDCSGTVQVVAAPSVVARVLLRPESAVTIVGKIRPDARAPSGLEVELETIDVIGLAAHSLPFTSASMLEDISQDIVLSHRPLSLRTERGTTIFRVQAALVDAFRAALSRRRFTEIFSSKIVSGGTEGGSNLFQIRYFDRVAYLAQSPQFHKEHCVLGLERVFETGHVYRAEPHASSRHLTEYYSLDLEMAFISGPEDIVELERTVLSEMFAAIHERFSGSLTRFDAYLPSLERAPIWTFQESLDRLQRKHGRMDLQDDLDPDAERKLCELAERECGVAAGVRPRLPDVPASVLHASDARQRSRRRVRPSLSRRRDHHGRTTTA